jgi:uncharacterized repeat protein (TIGR01451 family)
VGTRIAFRAADSLPVVISRSGDRWRTVFSAFPFEALDASAAAAVMDRAVGWLSWLGNSDWSADRRTVSSGSQVTMTCILRNDGPRDISSATFSTTLPVDLSLIPGSITTEAIYHTATRTVTWQGSIAASTALSIGFRALVTPGLPADRSISTPAHIGYDGLFNFERPYFLRVNAPDLSSSALAVDPALNPPLQPLTYTLYVRNTGVIEATAAITALVPSRAVLTGTLDHGGIGTGHVSDDTISWTGQVSPGQEVALRYHLVPLVVDDYWFIHRAQATDQYGELWHIEARTLIQPFKSYTPLVHSEGALGPP